MTWCWCWFPTLSLPNLQTVHLIGTSQTYLHHQLVVSCSVIFLIELISEVWGSRFLWKQEKTYSVDYIHHHFCLCISIEFTSLNLLSNSKKCKNFATHSDEAISTKLDFETWHGDMHVEGELPGANYKWLKRLPYHATKNWHWSFINYNALILLFTIHFSHVRLTLLSFNLTLI